jgi:hypothetical protein
MASFLSDLTKHPEVTPGPHRLRAIMQTVVDAYLDGPEAMRQWIEGFP